MNTTTLYEIIATKEMSMKTIFKFGYIILITAFVFGCSSKEVDKPLYNHLNNIKNGVDIWNSINYQIITDQQLIREVEPSSNDAFLINILVKLANKGELRAETLKVNFVESIPLKYTHGSGHEGISHGYLDKDEDYEVYRYYTFKSREDVEEFINKTNIIIEWKEKEENKQLDIKLPSNPTR
ncbi:hypothetical protein NV379_05130 [Paenibacillus sp. N1-5-1-14]|uniref:hypothetical protein n=1 Tax=Paenibacillus radicibacter TaxID=2972488 RepID=UPI002159A7AE|nr:hypothetical protein [Paenibacillus radicibacter]MCR8642034.1 hypothetical protein [Paenibacillus radicibacter]